MVRKIFLAIFLFLLLVPFRVFADPASDMENNPLCWKKADCDSQRKNLMSRFTQTDQEKAKIGSGWIQEAPCVEPYGKCLPPTIADTEIAFGGQNRFLGIGTFIQKIYTYAVGVAAIVAVVMIIIAGVQWTASGGNSEVISSAKKRISGALIGLLLAYLSYTLLSFINPALVNLRLPQAYMLRPSFLGAQEGQPCKADAECQTGLACIGATNPPLEQALNVFGAGLVAGVGSVVAIQTGAAAYAGQLATKAGSAVVAKLPVFTAWHAGGAVVGCAVAQATPYSCWRIAKDVGWTAYDAGASGAVGLYEYIKSIGAKGICMKAAKDLPRGALCDKYEQCASKKCLAIPSLSIITNGAGICSTGANGSVCNVAGDCLAGLNCIDVGKGDVKACSDGSLGAPCTILDGTDTCHAPFSCLKIAGGDQICVNDGAVQNAECKTDADCGSKMQCVKPPAGGGGFCKDIGASADHSSCYINNDCNFPTQHCRAFDSLGNETTQQNEATAGGNNLGYCN